MALRALVAAFRAARGASRSAAARKLFRAVGFRTIAQTSGRQAARFARLRAINTGVSYSRAVGAGTYSAGAAGIGAAVGIPLAVNQYRKANMPKRPGPTWPQNIPDRKRSRTSIPAVGANLRYVTKKEGRRPTMLGKMVRMAKGSEKYVIHRFGAMGTLGDVAGGNRGEKVLGSYVRTSQVAGQAYPVHLFNLTSYPQSFDSATTEVSAQTAGSNVNPPVHWGVQAIPNVGTNTGFSISYFEAPGVNSATGVGNRLNNPGNNKWAVAYRKDEATNNPTGTGSTPAIGRFGYLDWVSMRFLFYGKKNYDTKIYVSLIKFSRNEYCPEWNWRGNFSAALDVGIREELTEKWKTVVHPLINNPIATRESRRRSPFVVLESHPVRIPSKSSDDANADPEQVVFNLFKRFNKVVDFSNESRPTGLDIEEQVVDLRDENDMVGSSIEMGSQPKYVRDNIYLMVTAWDPLAPLNEVDLGGTTVSQFRNTYDVNISRRYTGGSEVYGR